MICHKLAEAAPVQPGRLGDTLNEPILAILRTLLLNYTNIKSGLDKLQLLVSDPAYSERASKMQFLL
jgi:hypothetical protein